MKPLEDIRVIAIEQYGAGPYGSLQLADLGAEIIKIEDPNTGGDVSRYVPPFQEGQDSLFFEAFNRNKRSIALDISTPEGRAVFEDLVVEADAVYSNLRGDVPAKLAIRYEDLAHLNPAIVCVSLSGFGMTGPRSSQPGYDYIMQALAGWMSLTGEAEGPPTKSGLSLVDFSAGYVASTALLAGVHAARRDGVGMDCDLSLYDVAVALLNYPATWHLSAGWEPTRLSRSAHPSLVPFQLFRGGDDEWFVLGCAKEKFFRRVCDAIGRPDLPEDERFSDFAARNDHREAIIAILDDAFATRSASDWMTVLGDAGVPVAPVQDLGEALTDEHTIARNLIVETDHPRFGTVRSVATPVRVGESTAGGGHRSGPRLNEDGVEILTSLLGYSSERIDELRARGAFGSDS
ncbi:MAG: CoA transferase [Acidimicrobiia bacterium]|nr:CoA transferase [Acidimicrobiia bacterium]